MSTPIYNERTESHSVFESVQMARLWTLLTKAYELMESGKIEGGDAQLSPDQVEICGFKRKRDERDEIEEERKYSLKICELCEEF